MARNKIPMKEKLLKRHNVTELGCWEWTGYTNKGGYGRTNESGTRRLVYVHRASYSIFIGPITNGSLVLHKCDNPPCFNPEHLFLGSYADNRADMVNKNRDSHGETHPSAKLTDREVRDIRRSYKPATKIGRGHKSNVWELAKRYGVGENYIRDILAGTWRKDA